jgi:Na+/H+ antiporter NhaC
MIDEETRAATRRSERRWGAAAALLASTLALGIVLVGSVGSVGTGAATGAAAAAGPPAATAGTSRHAPLDVDPPGRDF